MVKPIGNRGNPGSERVGGSMIEERYLLISYIPVYINDQGAFHRPTVEKGPDQTPEPHPQLDAALSLRRELHDGGSDLRPLEDSDYAERITYLDLPEFRSTLGTLTSLPIAVGQLWKAIGQTDIVTVGLGGWPIDLAWFVVPMARLRRRFLVVAVAGAWWRRGWRRPFRLKALIQAVTFEVPGAALRERLSPGDIYSCWLSPASLPAVPPETGHVVPASWIDEEIIFPKDRAEALWAEKLKESGRPLRAGFAVLPGGGQGRAGVARMPSTGSTNSVSALSSTSSARASSPKSVRRRRLGLARSITITMCGTLPDGPPVFRGTARSRSPGHTEHLRRATSHRLRRLLSGHPRHRLRHDGARPDRHRRAGRQDRPVRRPRSAGMHSHGPPPTAQPCETWGSLRSRQLTALPMTRCTSAEPRSSWSMRWRGVPRATALGSIFW